jgi:MRG-binding protein
MSVDSFLDTLHGELAFFRAITRARPVGVHRYFHVVTIRQLIKEETGSDVAVEEIWDKLRACYNLEALEGLVSS